MRVVIVFLLAKCVFWADPGSRPIRDAGKEEILMEAGGAFLNMNLRRQTPNLRGQIPNWRGQLPNLRGQLPNLRGQNPNLQGQIPNLRGQLPNLRGQIPNPNLRGQIPNLRGNQLYSFVCFSGPRRQAFVHLFAKPVLMICFPLQASEAGVYSFVCETSSTHLFASPGL